MNIVYLMLLIPIFFIGLIIYVMTLINYILSLNLDILFILISLLIVLITSFFIPKIIKNIMPNTIFKYKYENSGNIYYSYFCYFLLLLFGLSNIIASIIGKDMYLEFVLGISVLILLSYIFIKYINNYKKIVLKLEFVENLDGNIKELSFYNENDELIEYYTKEENYIENEYYQVKYNKNTKEIKKIIKKVINVK